jgi:hypothetical protein
VAVIDSAERLATLIGQPSPVVVRKFHDHLTAQAQDFLTRSTLAFLATVDAGGNPMVSPRGDRPGFLQVRSRRELLVPERSGNRLASALHNIVDNGRVALTALVPGTGEMLRVEGTACLDDDRELCAELASRGKPARLAIRVTPTRCYFHCAKALLRSEVWQPGTWPTPLAVSFGQEIAENGGLAEHEIHAFDEGVQGRYRTDL